ncbi:chaplin [Streptomyces sp. 3N207]|uniref:chaplin n=1 Tax=Streptomyces sp. 3N207 TaxID=3457417 RepID=UPI003FD3BA43
MRQGTRKGLLTMAAAGGLLAMSGGTALADSGAHGGSANSPGVLSGNNVEAPVNVTANVCGNTVNVVGLLNPASGNGCGNDGAGPQGGRGARAGGSTHDSPGVGSGNNAQVPVDVPVNVCGNTVDVGGALNPAHGNGCAGQPDPSEPGPGPVDPGYPEDPGKPGDPDRPGDPGDPGSPGDPDDPGDPGRPGDPQQPGQPGNPPGPGGPGEPTAPGASPQPGSTGEVLGGSVPEAVSGSSVSEKAAASEVSGAPSASHDPATAGADGELAHTGASSQLWVAAPLSAGLLAGGYVLYRRSRAAIRR